MKLAIVLSIALLSGSIPLTAQQGSLGVAGTLDPTVLPETQTLSGQIANCPVMLSASHLADGSMIRTGIRADRAHPKGIGQWLHITSMTPTAVSATFLIRGFSDKTRMSQAGSKNGPDATRTVTVLFMDMPNGQAVGNVWAPGLTAVDSLDLISLTYGDGSKWNAPSGGTCRVTPDPLMLISSRPAYQP